MAAVMVAHVATHALDSGGEDVGLPASLSPGAVGYLRDTLGFKGCVVSDDMEMGAITKHYGNGEAVVAGLKAGVDLFLMCHQEKLQHEAIDAIVAAVRAGTVSVERLRAAGAAVDALHGAYVRGPVDVSGGAASGGKGKGGKGRLVIMGNEESRKRIEEILAKGMQSGKGR